MKLTLKAMCDKFKIPYSTIKMYNSSGNTLDKRQVNILLLTYFVVQTKLNKNDLEHLKHFYKKKRSIREEIESEKTMELLNQKYWQLDLEDLQLAKELYLFNLSKKDLQAIYQIKKNGGKK